MLDIAIFIILGSILYEYEPEKNEVDKDFDVQNINRLTLNDIAENEEELILIQEF